jgi:hypothetical protein
MSKVKIEFEEALDKDDWGLIIGKDGRLKGMFIPEGCTEDDVPDSIIELCIKFFNIDPEEFELDDDNEPKTIH